MSDFAIYPVKAAGGILALSPMPGRGGDLAGDVARIADWGAGIVISMTTDDEFARFHSGDLATQLSEYRIAWRRIPVEDFSVPDAVQQARWLEISRAARAVLADGGRVLIHCMGGCGRSGMAALRIMVEAGADPAKALARLRAQRPCAVETDAQFAWAAAAGEIA